MRRKCRNIRCRPVCVCLRYVHFVEHFDAPDKIPIVSHTIQGERSQLQRTVFRMQNYE